MPEISVIICCYNSSDKIAKTLECLAAQKFTKKVFWEIILVNNNSSDDTTEIVNKTWERLFHPVPLILINEPLPGLSNAREAGIKKSGSDLIIFCDDDNRLFEDYIQKAFEVMTADIKIAALGGCGFPDYEITPPSYIEKHVNQYATGPQNDLSGDITISKGYVYGAGIVIRKNYYNFIKEKGFSFMLTGRKGAILTSGEDFEMCAAFVLCGFKIYYHSDLKFSHYLPKSRLSWDYLKRMNQGFGYSLAFLLPYITLIGHHNKKSLRLSYSYFLVKFLLKQFQLAFYILPLLEKSDKRLEWERTKYVVISLLKNSSAIKNLIKELPEKKFIQH